MKQLRVIIFLIVVLPMYGVQRLCAQSDAVCAIISDRGGSTYAAASLKNSEGCLKYADTKGMFLRDSSLVMTAGYMKWKKIYDAESDGFLLFAYAEGKFLAVGGNDGKVNMVKFVNKTSAAVFTESDYGICTTDDGKELCLAFRRYTKSGKADMDFCFVGKGRINGRNCFAARSYPLSSPGTVKTGKNGEKIYEGRFNSHLVSLALDSATTSVDFTNAVMPNRLTDFKCADTTNCIVYMRSEDAEYAPRQWRNVVSVSKTGAHLVRKTVLHDGMPFFALHPFTAGKDSLVYTRVLPRNGWNTIILPFAVSEVSEKVGFFVLSHIDNSEVMLEKSDSIKALTPYVMRLEEGGYGNISVMFKAAEGTEVSSRIPEWEADILNGTFSRFDPPVSNAAYMFLSNDGCTFSLAAEGSYLSPFRCGFMFTRVEGTKDLRLVENGTVGAENIVRKDLRHEIFSINGVRMPNAGNMPKGIYIINGKKTYRR